MTPPPSRPAAPARTLRLALLLAATLAWLWAISPCTPWAVDRAPRLWLYDLLFYVRVVLLAWAVAEVALLVFRRERRTSLAIVLLAATALAWIAARLYDDSGIGWRLRTQASLRALDALAAAGDGDVRRRAGHLLVDTVRMPCGPQSPWLWLGRPHGGGSGTNLALVRGGADIPASPVRDAFVFRRLDAGWWLAYENAARHHAGMPHGACVPGRTVASHRAGLAHVMAGGQD